MTTVYSHPSHFLKLPFILGSHEFGFCPRHCLGDGMRSPLKTLQLSPLVSTTTIFTDTAATHRLHKATICSHNHLKEKAHPVRFSDLPENETNKCRYLKLLSPSLSKAQNQSLYLILRAQLSEFNLTGPFFDRRVSFPIASNL